MKQNLSEKKIKLSSAIAIAGVVSIICFVIGANFTNWFSAYAPYLGFKKQKNIDWSSLDTVYDVLANNYDGEINTSALIEGAKKGLTDAVGDIYTEYMSTEVAADYMDSLHGNIGAGVGIEMGLREGYVKIIRTLPDNPAQRAGILAGDIIYAIDDEEVYALPAATISQKVRGDAGTEVTVSVIRDGQKLDFVMIRETINNVSTYVEYEGQTAIITITRFDTDTGTMVQKFAKDFEGRNINKIILDLRNNGGGYVSAARDLLSLWIDGDNYYIQKSIHFGSNADKTYSGRAIFKDIKTVVLVNNSTASASEIVAGALQDYEKATILGEKTYGKGVVQELCQLGDALLKVTTAHWYTPKGRSINKEGIVPDIEVIRTYEDINTMKDPQMEEAKKI